MTDPYAKVSEASSSFNEHNDCAVKAISILCDVPYHIAHKALSDAGRRDRGRTKRSHQYAAIKSLGYKLIPVATRSGYLDEKKGYQFGLNGDLPWCNKAKTVISLAKVLPKRGKFMVHVRGHVLACRGGKVLDWSEGTRRHIVDIFRVVKA